MSKFTIGAIVAVMEDHTVVRQDVVTKVYKNGNFTLRDSDGQFRQNGRATQQPYRWRTLHAELWSTKHTEQQQVQDRRHRWAKIRLANGFTPSEAVLKQVEAEFAGPR